MTDHWEQQAWQDNIDQNQAIPLGLARQTQNDKYCRRHSKTIWKPDIAKQNIHPQWTINTKPDITITKER